MSRTRHHRDRRALEWVCSWGDLRNARHRVEPTRREVEDGLRFHDDYPRGVVLGLFAAHGQPTKVAHLDDDMSARWERDHLHHRGRRRSGRERADERWARQMQSRVRARLAEMQRGQALAVVGLRADDRLRVMELLLEHGWKRAGE